MYLTLMGEVFFTKKEKNKKIHMWRFKIIILTFLNVQCCGQSSLTPLAKILIDSHDEKKDSLYSDTLIFKIGNHFIPNETSAIVLKKINQDDYELSIFKKLKEPVESIIDTLQIGTFLDFKAEDINNDKIKDIIILTGSNRPCNYLYVFQDNQLVCIDNCTKWPEFKTLPVKGYGYTYKNNGCASANWSSALVQIIGSTAVQRGKLTVRTCKENFMEIILYDKNGEQLKIYQPTPKESQLFQNDLANFWQKKVNTDLNLNDKQ